MICQQIFKPIETALNVKNPLINKESRDNEKNCFLKNELFDKYSSMYRACVGVGMVSMWETSRGEYIRSFVCLVGLVGWLAGQLFVWLVGWLFSWLFGCLVSWLVS